MRHQEQPAQWSKQFVILISACWSPNQRHLRLAEAYSKGQPAVKIYPELGDRFRELAIRIEKVFKENGNAGEYMKNKINIETTEIT